jgi:transposase
MDTVNVQGKETHMDFNTLLLRLGIDPGNFVNRDSEPIREGDAFIYSVEQRTDLRECPRCHARNAEAHAHYYAEVECSETDFVRDVLRIRKTRFLCKSCGRTFTMPVSGVARYATVSEQKLQAIRNDFLKPLTFQQIADRYGISESYAIRLFDAFFRSVPRRPLPRILCIDEVKYSENENEKYACVLYDFEAREVVDVVRSRQMPYLREYFGRIPEKERRNAEYFVSDMYDAYATVKSNYFPKAVHIVDLFHAVEQLTAAVNRLRTRAMNLSAEKGSMERNFMKSKWPLFLRRSDRVPDRTYSHKATGELEHYDDMLFRCVRLDPGLWEAHSCLQEFLSYDRYPDYGSALAFVERMAKKLQGSGNDLLRAVGSTYRRWRYEIASGLASNQNGGRITNGIAEAINNHIKTSIKSAYGYRNFERFRKRVMLIVTYSKKG